MCPLNSCGPGYDVPPEPPLAGPVCNVVKLKVAKFSDFRNRQVVIFLMAQSFQNFPQMLSSFLSLSGK